MTKKKAQPWQAKTSISDCTFNVLPESDKAVEARAEAIKAMAEAFSRVADALKAGTNSAPIIEIKQK